MAGLRCHPDILFVCNLLAPSCNLTTTSTSLPSTPQNFLFLPVMEDGGSVITSAFRSRKHKKEPFRTIGLTHFFRTRPLLISQNSVDSFSR
jgi:hypothetical protein